MEFNKKTLLKVVIISLALTFSGLIVNNANDSVQAATMNNEQQAVVDLAKQQLGKPYVWGATGPRSFDCSGLVQYVFSRAAGINLPRVTTQQEENGFQVSLNALKPGDLLFWGNHGSTYHVAIYIGDNNFIQASQPGDVVRITNLQSYYPNFAKRILSTDPDFPMKPIDESVAVIKYDPGYGILAFHKNGKRIEGSNKKFIIGTKWKVVKTDIINDEEMFLVGNDTYIPRQYTNLDDRIITVNYVPGYGVLTWHADGTSTGRRLSTGKRFKTFGKRKINGSIMYLVGKDEYIPKQYTQFGPGK